MKYHNIYVSGEYLKKNPTWHAETAPIKIKAIQKMLARDSLMPQSICEVGCGAGEILAQLQKHMDPDCDFQGYDISPQAIALAKQKENSHLHFTNSDFLEVPDLFFDLILMIDMIEHVENCLDFLRKVQAKSTYKLIQFGLDLTVEALLLRPNKLLGFRDTDGHVGHLHYFTKNIALALLEDLGYEVLDFFYTPVPVSPNESFKNKCFQRIREALFAVHHDTAVRLIGGYKLVVLAK